MRKYKPGIGKSIGGHGKFKPKLTFEERCGLFIASKLGIPDHQILAASGMNRSSVTRLLDGGGKAYKNVRDEYERLGEAEFRAKYYTEEMKMRLATAAAGPG